MKAPSVPWIRRRRLTRSERKPTLSGVGASDSRAHQSTADDRPHPKRLIWEKRYREARKTAKTWLLGWGQPGWPKAYHSVPSCSRAAPRPARAHKKQPCAGLGRTTTRCGGVSGRWPGPRPRANRGTTVAGSGYGLSTSRQANTPDPVWGQPGARKPEYPRGESCRRVWHRRDAHRDRNPRLQPWEEVK